MASPAAVPAALREARNLVSRIESLLEASGDPQAREFAAGGVDRALRRVQIEVEELLEGVRRRRSGAGRAARHTCRNPSRSQHVTNSTGATTGRPNLDGVDEW
jgi:hypothetical protein